MNRILQEQTFTIAILQKKTLINWGILGSLMLAFMLSATSSFATCYGNVNDGGEIGSNQTICSGESTTLTNEDLPSGGFGDLEYLWLSNTNGPETSGANSYSSSSPTYNTGSLTETTWFRRCSRRDGCSSWDYGESNWVKVTVGNAVFEHVDGVDESACGANDGKIITDPYIDQGTVLPYSVEYTYNGQVFSAGPYANNQDNYITGLAPGVYSNITITDANNCSSVWGSNITIAEYSSGCTPNTDCTPVTLAKWDMNACTSFYSNGTNFDYSEFTAAYPNDGSFGNVAASIVDREVGAHSCIAGQGGSTAAACFAVGGITSYSDNHDLAIRFSITLTPDNGETGKLTSLNFYEMAPDYYSHLSGNSGTNDFPTKYGMRVLKDGVEIFQSIDIPTTETWSLETFDFSSDTDFCFTNQTTFSFELLSYDKVGNGGQISAWDLDNIKIKGVSCGGATVGDFVFNDVNGNGIQEAGDFGLQGVSVMLINADDNTSETTTTNADGIYSFTNVTPGNYKVKFPTTGSASSLTYNLTQPNQGNDGNVDSDPIDMNNGSGNAMTEIFVVNAGENIDSIDAGYYIGSKIAGIAFIETDVDGLQNGTEARLDGITVMLLDENGNMIATTSTANGGTYEFDNLAPGSYKVKFPEDAIAAGIDYSLTRSEIGSDDDIDSDAVPMNDGSGNAMTQIVYVENGATVDNLDAGYYPLARIGDKVFQDVNENGIQDIEDIAYDDVNIMLIGTDIFGNGVNESTSPDGNGNYEFRNVVPGTYELKFTSNQVTFVPTIKDFSGNGFDNVDSDIYPNNGLTDAFTINAGDSNQTIDAGFIFDQSLPVQLISFEAQLVNGNQVVLKWATASEINNRHFVVERSTDGNDFRPIGLVEGNGTTNLMNQYSLDDLDPFYGANYYRLKQVDLNGDSEYSHVETVIVSGNDLPDVIVYPNPVIKTTTLRVVTPFETDAQIEIVNQAGQVMKVLTMEAGANSKQLDLSNYTAGIYFAYINYNGHRTLVYNIVKVEE